MGRRLLVILGILLAVSARAPLARGQDEGQNGPPRCAGACACAVARRPQRSRADSRRSETADWHRPLARPTTWAKAALRTTPSDEAKKAASQTKREGEGRLAEEGQTRPGRRIGLRGSHAEG